jgi:hypothetical protein
VATGTGFVDSKGYKIFSKKNESCLQNHRRTIRLNPQILGKIGTSFRVRGMITWPGGRRWPLGRIAIGRLRGFVWMGDVFKKIWLIICGYDMTIYIISAGQFLCDEFYCH